MSPDMPDFDDFGPNNSTHVVLAEIEQERAHQDAKWGEQNHLDGTGHKKFAAKRDAARAACERAAAHGAVTESGFVTWRHILREEFYEALAETDPEALRAELIQVAAVAVAWVEAIDRREGIEGPAEEGEQRGWKAAMEAMDGYASHLLDRDEQMDDDASAERATAYGRITSVAQLAIHYPERAKREIFGSLGDSESSDG